MQKVKSNALWKKLSAKQQETLDKWLFDERLSYVEAWTRAKSELGYTGSKTSVHRYYARRDKERILTKFLDARDQTAAVNGAPVDEKELWKASMKLLAEFLFQQIRLNPDKVKEWGMIATLMVDNNRNELLREIKGEELKVRQKALAFAEKKFQFDVARRALKALPQLEELAEAKKDPLAKEYEENIGFNRVIRRIFGPLAEVEPESDREAAEMLAAIRERKARQEAEAERLQRREELNSLQPPPPSSQYHKEYMQAKAELEETYRQSPAKAPAPVLSEAEQKLREMERAQAAEAKKAKPEKLRKPSKQYQEYLDKLKLWEEKRELLGWQEMPQPVWSGRWPMTEEDE